MQDNTTHSSMNMYTDRQIALQCAIEFCKRSTTVNSYKVVAIAERYRKFLEDGTIEARPEKESSTQSQATRTGGFRPKVGSLCGL